MSLHDDIKELAMKHQTHDVIHADLDKNKHPDGRLILCIPADCKDNDIAYESLVGALQDLLKYLTAHEEPDHFKFPDIEYN